MPAVQHARLAARPAGWHHGPPCANTTASAWRREPGVADTDPLLPYTTDTHKHIHIPTHMLSAVQVPLYMCLITDRRNWSYYAETHKNVNLLLSFPLLSLPWITKGFPDISSR